jgi:H+/Cl- antiporter ClcA
MKVLILMLFGLALASIAVFFDNRIFGSGKEIMVSTLFTTEKGVPWYLPLLRIIGPIFSFSSGAAGGIFAPSLSAGASIGAVVAGWFQSSPVEANLLILCGMAGFLTSITRSPFTSSIIILEMTNTHNVIFYIMLTCLASSLTATLISRRSFYDKLKEQFIKELQTDENEEKPAVHAELEKKAQE